MVNPSRAASAFSFREQLDELRIAVAGLAPVEAVEQLRVLDRVVDTWEGLLAVWYARVNEALGQRNAGVFLTESKPAKSRNLYVAIQDFEWAVLHVDPKILDWRRCSWLALGQLREGVGTWYILTDQLSNLREGSKPPWQYSTPDEWRAGVIAPIEANTATIREMLAHVRHALEERAREPTPDGGNVFSQKGDYWELSFGDKTVDVKHVEGMSYIAILLAKPEKLFRVTELFHAVKGGPPPGVVRSHVHAGGEEHEAIGTGMFNVARGSDLPDEDAIETLTAC